MTTVRHLVAGLCLPACFALGCHAQTEYVQPLTPVTTVDAASSLTGTRVRYSGSVKPAVEVTAAFKVGGYVDDLLVVRSDGVSRDVQVGDRVSRGASLARVRSADYEQRVAQAKAGVAEGEAMRANAQLNFERATRLFELRSLTKPELDAAKAQLEAVTAKVDGARAMLREVELTADDVVLKAPIDGVVLRRLVERGSLVGPGSPAFVLADTSTIKVAFGVPDVVVKTLRIGQEQRVRFDAIKDEQFEGRLTSIAPSPDPVTRVYEVELTLANPGGRIDVGFIASLLLADAPGREAVTVPLDTIVKPPSGPGEYAVYVAEGSGEEAVARLRPVTLGEALGNQIVVASGLRAGERVVERGATLVIDGQKVRVLPPSGTP